MIEIYTDVKAISEKGCIAPLADTAALYLIPS